MQEPVIWQLSNACHVKFYIEYLSSNFPREREVIIKLMVVTHRTHVNRIQLNRRKKQQTKCTIEIATINIALLILSLLVYIVYISIKAFVTRGGRRLWFSAYHYIYRLICYALIQKGSF